MLLTIGFSLLAAVGVLWIVCVKVTNKVQKDAMEEANAGLVQDDATLPPIELFDEYSYHND